jgi:hypothetical protein
MKTAYDKHKRDLFFKPDDMVLLRTTHITLGGKRKFLPRFLGPFRVVSPIGVNAYKLDLPPYWRIHNVFNVSLLKPFYQRETDTSSQYVVPAILDDYSVVVESIQGHRYVNTKQDPPDSIPHKKRALTLQYKVHFSDTNCENDTWEFLKDIPSIYYPIVHQYHSEHNLAQIADVQPCRRHK